MVETVTKSLHHSCRSELHAIHCFQWHRLYLYLTTNIFHHFNIRYQRVVALVDLSCSIQDRRRHRSDQQLQSESVVTGSRGLPSVLPARSVRGGASPIWAGMLQERIAPFRGKIVLPDKEFRSLYIRRLSSSKWTISSSRRDAQRAVSEDPPIGRPEFPADCPIFIIFTALPPGGRVDEALRRFPHTAEYCSRYC